MNFKFQKNVAIVLSSVIIGTTALSGVNVYADEITATEEDVSLSDDIFDENDIIYGISTQSSDAETTLTKSEMSAFAQAFNDSLKEDNINVSNGYGRGVKSKAAKIAAKAMLKKLKHIGAKAFEKAIRKAAKKLPKAAAEKVEKYLTYQKVSAVLNIAANADNINVSNGYGRGDNYRRNSACITKSRNSKNICGNRSKINCICFVLGR